jgi:UDP-N-acetyl-D-mannosaminuronic acid transferase (WecB/TagA/CpsF family)
MRILIVSQYFWPEYFRVNDLAIELSKNHIVDVLTGSPNYPSGKIFSEFKKNKENYNQLGKIRIYRVPIYPRGSANKPLLIFNYLSFLFSSIFYGTFLLRKKKYDIVITFASSPIIVALISIFICKLKNAKHIIWLLDLWPSVLHDLKIIDNQSILYKIFNKIVNYIYKNSDLILCQSLSFRSDLKKIKKLSTNFFKKKVVFFPSWPEEILINTTNKNPKTFFDRNFINILFTGNLGESQNFTLIIKLFKFFLIEKKNIRLYIAGEGRFHSELKKTIIDNNINNIILLGWKNFDDLQEYFQQADYLLISLQYHDTFNKTIPGKFQTYLKYKKPIVGFLGGETNKLINKYKIGKAFNYFDDETFFKDVNNYFTDKKRDLNFTNFERLLKIFSKEKRMLKLNLYIKKLIAGYFEPKFNLLLEGSKINYKKNFTISALNLAFLGYYAKGLISENENLYLWPDGYFRRRFLPESIKKLPGRDLLKNLNLNDKFIKKIIVLGNLEEVSKTYLEKLYKIPIHHIKLPYGDLKDFINSIPLFKKDEVCIITLPSPKQEILANYIMSNQNHFKIFCFGGAINMASGIEKPLPEKYNKIFFLEALWRLQFDTYRRIKRLSETFLYYLIGEIFRSYKNIKFNIINGKF